MHDFITAVFLVFAGLFPVVNPVGGAPLFLQLTAGATAAERTVIAAGVARFSFLLLVAAFFVGAYVLEFFGITLPIVRIGGGFVIAAFAWQLLQAPDSSGATVKPQEVTPGEVFYPLTLPLTVGPGEISVAITLGTRRPHADGVLDFALLVGGSALGIAAIAVSVYVCYRYAERLAAFLGEGGTNALIRLSAFIMLCIGIGIAWEGYAALTAPAAPPEAVHAPAAALPAT
ncbi:MAG TPA: MarC family protein [Bauldia sp.]|nr:MarC family protein [Bauldia sp.]